MSLANLKQAQELKAKLDKVQKELANITVEASSGGGAVKVTMNGQQKPLSVKIAPEVVNPQDVAMLEDLILAAISEAQAKAQEAAAKQMSSLTGGLNIPGLT